MLVVPLGRRILQSLVSIVIGWGTALLAYVAALAVLGNVRDVGAAAAWTLAFALVGWVLVGLPLVCLVDARSRVFQAWWGPLVGAAIAFSTFLVLAGRWFAPGTEEFNLFAGFTAVTGGVTWRAYAVLGRDRNGNAMSGPPN